MKSIAIGESGLWAISNENKVTINTGSLSLIENSPNQHFCG
jgi:hypothetical protein